MHIHVTLPAHKFWEFNPSLSLDPGVEDKVPATQHKKIWARFVWSNQHYKDCYSPISCFLLSLFSTKSLANVKVPRKCGRQVLTCLIDQKITSCILVNAIWQINMETQT